MGPNPTPLASSEENESPDEIEEITCTLKKEINNLIWMYGPSSLTLGKAEWRQAHKS